MISYLAIVAGGHPVGPIHVDVLASRSTDGGLTWGTPVIVRLGGPNSFLDKNWSVCDDTASSPFFGNCYTEWDNAAHSNLVQMSTSTDGAKTWSVPETTADRASVEGGQPVVQPNGTVVVPIVVFKANFTIADIGAFTSTNGGASWSSTVKIATINAFFEHANVRNPDLPSAEVDGAGRVYVSWYDCRFEPGCSANDIVISTSDDGVNWSAVKRVPIDSVGSGIDHFTPGIGVDKTTSGNQARIGLTYYSFTNANCVNTTCQLNVGFISSTNGGASWSSAEHLAGPMKLTWLAFTSQGYMYGDYISTSTIPDDEAFGVFAVAQPPTGTLHEAMFTTPEDTALVGGNITSGGDQVVATASPSSMPVSRTAF